MKKIIALFVLMVGFSFTASAQKKTSVAKPSKVATTTAANTTDAAIQEAAIKDTKALNDYIKLTNEEMQSFKGLFEYKHQSFASGLTDERKKIISDTVEAKINATLTPEQVTKLSSNKALLTQLLN
jgi:uncharacterized protein (UPF0264 family)